MANNVPDDGFREGPPTQAVLAATREVEDRRALIQGILLGVYLSVGWAAGWFFRGFHGGFGEVDEGLLDRRADLLMEMDKIHHDALKIVDNPAQLNRIIRVDQLVDLEKKLDALGTTHGDVLQHSSKAREKRALTQAVIKQSLQILNPHR